jgi:hypothetical protein
VRGWVHADSQGRRGWPLSTVPESCATRWARTTSTPPPPPPPPPMQDIQGEAPIDWEPTERVVDEDEDEVEDACSDDEETGDADSRSAHSSAEKECKIQMCIVQFVYGHVHREARTVHARLRVV